MKLDSLSLAFGGPAAISAFIAKCMFPYRLHSEDMSAVVSKVLDEQGYILYSPRYSVSIWDTAWPHRVWMFSKDYQAFNRAEDEPTCGHYVQPILQISAQRSRGELQASVIKHVLKRPVEK
jgi:hypothetical protein